MKKRVLAVVLTLMMCFCATAFTAQAQSTEKIVVLTKEQAILLAEKWQEKNYDEDVQIDNVIPIYDSVNTISAYSIGFTDGEEDKGYVVINTDLSQELVREFALTGKDLYEMNTAKYDDRKDLVITERKLYESGSLTYAMKAKKSGNDVYIDRNKIITKSEFEERIQKHKEFKEQERQRKRVVAKSTTDTGYFLDAIVSGNYDVFDGLVTEYAEELSWLNSIRTQSINGFPVRQEDFQEEIFENNSEPVALTNIVLLYYLSGSNLTENPYKNLLKTVENSSNPSLEVTYNTIVNYIDYEYIDYDTQYLETIDVLADMLGYIDYVEGCGYDILSSPFYEETSADFAAAVDRDHPVHTTLYDVWWDDDLERWITDYFVVVTIGYKVLSNSTCYLNIIDGFTLSYDRWINSNDTLLSSVQGVEINIYKRR